VVDGAVFPGEAGGAVEHGAGPDGADEGLAQVRLAALAVEAAAAGGGPVEDDVVAGLEVVDVTAGGFDDASAFVAGNEGHGVAGGPGDEVVVAVADAAGGKADEYFTFLGFLEVHFFDDKGHLGAKEEGSLDFHGAKDSIRPTKWHSNTPITV
jgi:hypothetical protein